MKNKTKGILTPIITIILMIPTAIVTTLILESTSSDGWAALGALIMIFMLTGVIIIIELIVGAFLFFKKKSRMKIDRARKITYFLI